MLTTDLITALEFSPKMRFVPPSPIHPLRDLPFNDLCRDVLTRARRHHFSHAIMMSSRYNDVILSVAWQQRQSLPWFTLIRTLILALFTLHFILDYSNHCSNYWRHFLSSRLNLLSICLFCLRLLLVTVSGCSLAPGMCGLHCCHDPRFHPYRSHRHDHHGQPT